MRKRRLLVIRSALMTTFVALVAAPIAASAASGLPSTIAMTPEAAGPGSRVVVVGLDFPGATAVDLQLITIAGSARLATTITQDGGYFRETLFLPADIAPGFWELRATAASGVAAVHIFDASKGAATALSGEGAATADTAASVANAKDPGFVSSNLLVVLVLVLLVGMVGGTTAHAWKQVRRPGGQPGMPRGADPIWSGGTGETR